MKPIEFENWRPRRDDPSRADRAGQRSAEEVFAELEQRLDSMGMLPDEYLLMDTEWRDGRLIPEGADIFVTTDYGGSEGIYLDGYLKWYENGRSVTRSFFTGKTLGESGADMDRMFLIASAITKAFHGCGRGPENGMVLHLNADEKEVLINALVEKRESMIHQTNCVEQLLRHAVGSITAYMDEVGERPLRISEYDKTILAIQDGELDAFMRLSRVVGSADKLLPVAANRAGPVGRKMTLDLLLQHEHFSKEAYLEASRNAVCTGDIERVKFLMDQYHSHVSSSDNGYYGEVIDYACDKNTQMARELIAYAPNEWIEAADSSLHIRMSSGGELRMSEMLLRKGLQPGSDASIVLQNYTCLSDRFWMAEQLIKDGMSVDPEDYYSFDVCVRNKAIDCAKLLLDRGADLEGYVEWANLQRNSHTHEETISELRDYWQSIQPQEQAEQDAPVQEMTFGGLSQ